MKKIIYFAAVALILAACSSEEPTSLPNKSNETVGHNPYRVTLNDALKTADMLLDDIAGDAQTRSGKQRRVASVEYMTNPGTRASGSDTLLYLVNYADDAGFALLSADSRLRPVYAISDEGSLSFADTTYNKGLALFAQGVEADVTTTITNSISNPGIIDTIVPFKRVVREVAPLLNYYQRRWSQGDPYNQYCINSLGQNKDVGCGPVAVGMIMSFYSHPSSYAGYTFNWAEMKSGNNNENIARFLHLLADENNLQIDYDISSGTTEDRFKPTFTNMGYTNHEEFKYFNEEEICAILDKWDESILTRVGPVLVVGQRLDGLYNKAHAWVIDGYVQYEVTSPLIDQEYELDDILFHCVWGWGGACNGYYYWAKTNSLGGRPNELDSDDSYTSSTGYIYDISLKYMGNFRKVLAFNPNL